MRRSDIWLPERILYRCVNVRIGHTKGHQMQDGRIFANGAYISNFSFMGYRDKFLTGVYVRFRHLLERLAELETLGETQESTALHIHREDILRFFFSQNRSFKGKPIINTKVCLSCLFYPPEHALSCGHVLCTVCTKAYGRLIGKNIVQIQECPLDDESLEQCQPRIIHLKPDCAGVRILTLDECVSQLIPKLIS